MYHSREVFSVGREKLRNSSKSVQTRESDGVAGVAEKISADDYV
jgi:hypothetical protein